MKKLFFLFVFLFLIILYDQRLKIVSAKDKEKLS